jgi:shikimate dehydrogenase
MLPMPTGTTRVAALLGYPATYSLSPVLHNTAYQHLGVDAVYVVFPTKTDHLAAAVESIRVLNMLGASITIPHKEAVGALCDEVTPVAQRLGAVNCIANVDGRLVGHNTDGSGFVRALQADLGFDPAGKRCVVLGAGGAAKAVIASLAASGADEVVVVNRSADRAREAALLAGDGGRVGVPEDAGSADLVVNATPVGMVGEWEERSPLDAAYFRSGQVVVDLIYKPERTVLLNDAERAGARVANGLGMLIHQAAEQIRIWSGKDAPVALMRSAVGE